MGTIPMAKRPRNAGQGGSQMGTQGWLRWRIEALPETYLNL
jgi:hypothetical protein